MRTELEKLKQKYNEEIERLNFRIYDALIHYDSRMFDCYQGEKMVFKTCIRELEELLK